MTKQEHRRGTKTDGTARLCSLVMLITDPRWDDNGMIIKRGFFFRLHKHIECASELGASLGSQMTSFEDVFKSCNCTARCSTLQVEPASGWVCAWNDGE